MVELLDLGLEPCDLVGLLRQGAREELMFLLPLRDLLFEVPPVSFLALTVRALRGAVLLALPLLTFRSLTHDVGGLKRGARAILTSILFGMELLTRATTALMDDALHSGLDL